MNPCKYARRVPRSADGKKKKKRNSLNVSHLNFEVDTGCLSCNVGHKRLPTVKLFPVVTTVFACLQSRDHVTMSVQLHFKVLHFYKKLLHAILHVVTYRVDAIKLHMLEVIQS